MAFALNRIRIELIFKRVLPGMLFVKCRDRYDNRSGNAVLTTKINKSRRAVSCESNEGIDSGSRGCCTFQLSLVYNRVCWDFV